MINLINSMTCGINAVISSPFSNQHYLPEEITFVRENDIRSSNLASSRYSRTDDQLIQLVARQLVAADGQ